MAPGTVSIEDRATGKACITIQPAVSENLQLFEDDRKLQYLRIETSRHRRRSISEAKTDALVSFVCKDFVWNVTWVRNPTE